MNEIPVNNTDANKRKNHLKALNEKMVIRGKVTPLTPLHIGWQRSFDPVSSDTPIIKNPVGTPLIPGSSFKGILRSFVEGFLDGAVDDGRTDLKPCFITDNQPCIDKDEMKAFDDSPNAKVEKLQYILANACPVCRLFGGAYLGAKLKIKDMPVKPDDWHETFRQNRDGIIIHRDSRTVKDKGKYDFEIVSPGVPFHMEIIGDNLMDDEKGMLFTAFDLISQGYGSLGGNVSRGLGRVKIEVSEIEILKPGDFFRQYFQNNGTVEPVIKKDKEKDDYMKHTISAFTRKFGNH